MQIGNYTFQQFKEKAASFHGYPAPGLLIGGYMVELAKSRLPEGTLFDAVVETGKCLPDAVQLLTLCSFGNGWMKISNLGRYALSLYDKYSGEGYRVWLDAEKLSDWPEIESWFLKKKAKKDQDTPKLFREIEQAGDSICSVRPIQIDKRYLGHPHMKGIALCPSCGEAFPESDGAICRGCAGEAPYTWRTAGQEACGMERAGPELRAVPVEHAMGKKALHDMTRIDPGKSKGVEFAAGDTFTPGDVCRLQQMGRNRVYLAEDAEADDNWVHENDAVAAFAKRMAGENVVFDEHPHEGKLNFSSSTDGLLVIDTQKLERFNLVENVMCATRQTYTYVEAGKNFAGTRAIPLYISKASFTKALAVLGDSPLMYVAPLSQAKVGILVTGSEVFQGLIEDKFIPIISAKAKALNCEVAATDIVPDDREAITAAVRKMQGAGADILVTTAGLSVDPDDVTRHGLTDAGLTDTLYGAPLLPGTMTLLGRIASDAGEMRVIGVPACALYFKTTSFDLLFPRLLAGLEVSRYDLARMGEGGFCLSCRSCTFPKCPFGK